MKDKWRDSTWGEEISLEYGKALRGYDLVKGKFRVYGSNGPIGWTSQPLASGPGVILGRKGAYRGVQYSQNPFFVIDTAYYVVPKKNLDMRWLYYAIKYYKLGEIDDGSPIPSTTRSAVYIRHLRVPPPSEQRVIAGILSAIDDKIELNQQMNVTLESMANALFKSWLIDFDPVRAKLDGRPSAGLGDTLAALFPNEFHDSSLGSIPKGWRDAKLGDVIEIMDSKRIPMASLERKKRQGIYPYYGAASVMDHVDNYLFDGIYLLMGEDGSVINEDGTPVIQYVWGKFWVNNHAHVLRGINGVCTEHILLHLKNCNITPFVTGAVQPKLNQGNMNRIGFTLPPPEICTAFAKLIEPLFATIRANADQSRTLISLRDTLLPKLLSGEISAPLNLDAVER